MGIDVETGSMVFRLFTLNQVPKAMSAYSACNRRKPLTKPVDKLLFFHSFLTYALISHLGGRDTLYKIESFYKVFDKWAM